MAEPQEIRLVIRLLGPFEVVVDGGVATGLESDSARALLAVLASEPGRWWPRAVLAEMMWPDRPEGAATSNLRHSLSVLRKALGDRENSDPALVADRNTVGLTTSPGVVVDLIEFERLAAASPDEPQSAAAWERALGLWRGSLLEGLRLKAGVEWDEWFAVTEERLRRSLTDLLWRLGCHYERAGLLEDAIASARRLVDIDPWDERGHRRVMRLLARDNRRSEALHHYARVCELLEVDLGTRPTADTARLAARIRSGNIEPAVETIDVVYPDWVFDDPHPVTPPLFVGRERALAWLDAHLQTALAGQGHVALIGGEAGSGKSLLMRRFAERAEKRVPDLLAATGRCNAHGGIGDPYLPFREILALLTGDVKGAYLAGALTREQAIRLWEAIPLTTRLIHERAKSHIGVTINGPPMVARLEEAMPGARWLDGLREDAALAARRTDLPAHEQPVLFDELRSALEGLSEIRPILLTIDDLQWADSGSTALLWHLARRTVGLRILLVVAFRTEEVMGDPHHRIYSVLQETQTSTADSILELGSDRGFVDALVDSEPNDLPTAFRDRLFAYTDGNPLLTVEVIRTMRDSGDLRRDASGVWRAQRHLTWDTMPAGAQAVVGMRLDRLPDRLRQDLMVAAVQGQEFDLETAAEVRGDPALVERLTHEATLSYRLVEPVGVTRRNGRLVSQMRFRHALFQRYLYLRLSDTERIRLHEATARGLETMFHDDPEPPVVDLAFHFEHARLVEPAVRYLHLAGQRANRMSAREDAILHLRRALDLLPRLPESPGRNQTELMLLVALHAAVMAVRGYASPEAEVIGVRVAELCADLPPSPLTSMALAGLGQVHVIRARYPEAIESNTVSLGAARALADPALESMALFGLGYANTWAGNLVDGHEQLSRAVDVHDPVRDAWLADVYGRAVGPEALVWLAFNMAQRGCLDQAIDIADRGIAMARELAHPFSLCHAIAIGGAVVRFTSGRGDTMQPFIDEVGAIARAEHFPFYLAATEIYAGLSAGSLGKHHDAIERFRAGVAGWKRLGIRAFIGWTQAEMAGYESLCDDPEGGLRRIERALPATTACGEDLSVLYLLVQRGRLLATLGSTEAGPALCHAMKVARAQDAEVLELRAATSLAEHLAHQGRRAAARGVLAPVVSHFTEGLDTLHLAEARSALDLL